MQFVLLVLINRASQMSLYNFSAWVNLIGYHNGEFVTITSSIILWSLTQLNAYGHYTVSWWSIEITRFDGQVIINFNPTIAIFIHFVSWFLSFYLPIYYEYIFLPYRYHQSIIISSKSVKYPDILISKYYFLGERTTLYRILSSIHPQAQHTHK